MRVRRTLPRTAGRTLRTTSRRSPGGGGPWSTLCAGPGRAAAARRGRRDAAGAAPAWRTGGDEEEDADLRTRLSKAQIAELSDAQKAELRQIVKEEPPQLHFSDNKVAWRAAALAASGEEWSLGPHWEKNAEVMQRALDAYCEPIPEPQAFLLGIPHRNSKEEYAGELWNVPRALASKKVHYRTLLEREMFLSNGNAASGAPFHEAYPNAVLDDGLTALTARAYEAQKTAAGIDRDVDYVKHILDKHDGEVRHWGARWWTPVPAPSAGGRGAAEAGGMPPRERKHPI